MVEKFITYLKFEEQIIDQMIDLASKQQDALVKYKITDLIDITRYQEQLAKNLKEVEEQRLHLLCVWFGINKLEAGNLKLSKIENHVENDDVKTKLGIYRNNIKTKLMTLNNLNITNRTLSNRARNSIFQVLSMLTNGTNQVYNVKV